jgi:hypothetical protein
LINPQAEHKENFGTWLQRAWNAAVRTAEATALSPLEELSDRIDRWEREMAALKGGDAVLMAEIADAARAGSGTSIYE